MRSVKMWAVVTPTGRIIGEPARSKSLARYSALLGTYCSHLSERELNKMGYSTVRVRVTAVGKE